MNQFYHNVLYRLGFLFIILCRQTFVPDAKTKPLYFIYIDHHQINGFKSSKEEKSNYLHIILQHNNTFNEINSVVEMKILPDCHIE